MKKYSQEWPKNFCKNYFKRYFLKHECLSRKAIEILNIQYSLEDSETTIKIIEEIDKTISKK